MNEEQLKELTYIMARLLAVLQINNAITENDRNFICGLITEEEWLGGKKE